VPLFCGFDGSKMEKNSSLLFCNVNIYSDYIQS
jgi:hypothetical protein